MEAAEKTKDSRLAREFAVALPIELDADSNISPLQDFIQKNFVDMGMCADFAIHDTDGHNPHAHILQVYLTPSATQEKDYEIDTRIDHHSFSDQGIIEQPPIHEGYIAKDMEKKGMISDRCKLNRQSTGKYPWYHDHLPIPDAP